MKFTKKFKYISVIVVIAVFFIASRGFRNLIKRKSEQARMEKQLGELTRENEKLKQEIRALESDKAYQEYLIRRELGYIKQDEIEYRFNRKDKLK